jgi:hypothetical protein
VAPCRPHTWLPVDLPPATLAFGDGEPSRAVLAAVGPALKATCNRIELETKQHRSVVFGSGAGPFGADAKRELWKNGTLGCYAGSKGAWAIEVGIFHRASDGVGEDSTWQLVYLTPDARRIAAQEARGENWDADGEGRIYTVIDGVHDFDGDGVDEVAVRTAGYASIDGFHDSGPILYHLQGGAIAAWDPVPGRKVIGSMDADHDGRVDLVLDGGGPWPELAHAVDGGRYVTDDEVTRAFLHAQCLLPPPPPKSWMGGLPIAVAPGEPAPVQDTSKQCAAVRAIDSCTAGK